MKKAKAAAGILAAGLSAAALFLTAGVRTEAAEAGMAEAPVYRTATPSQLEESIEEENPAFEEEGETPAEEPGSGSGEALEVAPASGTEENPGVIIMPQQVMKSMNLLKGAGLLGVTFTGNVADWERMNISASYNGSNLILNFDLEFYAGGGGSQLFAPHLSISPFPSFYGGVLNWTEPLTPSSGYGSLNLTRYNRTMGTSEADRFLTVAGTLTVDPGRISSLNENGELNVYAGGWGEGWQSYGNFKKVPDGWETAWKQANCSHPGRTCTYINDSLHEVKCSACGFSFGTEAHSVSGGKCSGCGHTFTVSGTVSYTINGRTYSENYTVLPGSQYKPKDFTGYITPTVTIPASGGNVKISYTPITYYIYTEGKTYTLKYDETALIAGSPRKGYTQTLYVVKEIT